MKSLQNFLLVILVAAVFLSGVLARSVEESSIGSNECLDIEAEADAPLNSDILEDVDKEKDTISNYNPSSVPNCLNTQSIGYNLPVYNLLPYNGYNPSYNNHQLMNYPYQLPQSAFSGYNPYHQLPSASPSKENLEVIYKYLTEILQALKTSSSGIPSGMSTVSGYNTYNSAPVFSSGYNPYDISALQGLQLSQSSPDTPSAVNSGNGYAPYYSLPLVYMGYNPYVNSPATNCQQPAPSPTADTSDELNEQTYFDKLSEAISNNQALPKAPESLKSKFLNE